MSSMERPAKLVKLGEDAGNIVVAVKSSKNQGGSSSNRMSCPGFKLILFAIFLKQRFRIIPWLPGADAEASEPVPRGPQEIDVPESVCAHTMQVLRDHAIKFNRVDKGDEPPLRVLKQNLFGEAVKAVPDGPGSIPKSCWIERDGEHYLGYRFDQDVCDEAVHASPALCNIFGAGDKVGAEQVLTKPRLGIFFV